MARSVSGERPIYGARVNGQIRIGTVVLDRPFVLFGERGAGVGFGIISQMTLVLDPEA